MEAKRAVPRSEFVFAKDPSTSSPQTTQPRPGGAQSRAPESPSTDINNSSNISTPPPPGSPHDSPSASNDKEGMLNMNEYAYNKVFVGGLHYDTRDGIYLTV